MIWIRAAKAKFSHIKPGTFTCAYFAVYIYRYGKVKNGIKCFEIIERNNKKGLKLKNRKKEGKGYRECF